MIHSWTSIFELPGFLCMDYPLEEEKVMNLACGRKELLGFDSDKG